MPTLARPTSSRASLSDLLAQLGLDVSQPPPEETPPQGLFGKVGGFFGNVVGDVKEFGAGIGHLAGNVGHDVLKLGAEVLPGEQSIERQPGYSTDDILKSLVFDPDKIATEGITGAVAPGIQTYLEEQYGINPLKADIAPDWGKVGHAAYHDPLNTLFDIYGTAATAGAGAGRYAKRLSDLGEDTAFTRRILPGTDPQSPLFDPTGKVKGGLRKRLRESGGEFSLFDEDYGGIPLPINPVRRGVRTGISNLLSSDVQKLQASLVAEGKGSFIEKYMKLPETHAERQALNAFDPKLAQTIRLIERAKEYGVTRLDLPPVARFRTGAEAAKRLARSAGLYYHGRDDYIREIQEAFDPELTDEQVKNLHRRAQGMTTGASPGRHSLDEIMGEIGQGGGWLRTFDQEVDPVRKTSLYDQTVERFTKLQAHVASKQDELAAAEAQLVHAPDEGAVALHTEHVKTLQDEIEAATDYAEDLTEWLEVNRKRLNGEHVDPETATIAKLRWIWHPLLEQSIDKRLLGGGYLEVMRRQFGPLLVERRAPRRQVVDEAGQPIEGVRPSIDEDKFDWDAISGANPDFHKNVRQEFKAKGTQSPIYFPHLDARKFTRGEWLLRRGTNMKQLVGNAPYRRNEYVNYVNGTYLTDDPVEAYSRRAAHMLRIMETHRLVDEVTHMFGRRITRMDEIADNERFFSPEAIKRLYRTRGEMDDAIAEARQALGIDDNERVLAHAINHVEKKFEAEALEAVQRGARPDMVDAWAIPKVVADKLESYSKYQVGWMGRVFWDGPMNVWRASVLSFSPRWLLNNLLGNTMFLKMQGGRLSDVVRSAFSPKFRKALDDWIAHLPEDVKAQVSEGLFGATQMHVQALGSAEKTLPGMLMGSALEKGPVKAVRSISHRMQQANEYIERHFRRASLLRGTEKKAAELGLKQTSKRFFTSLEDLERLTKGGIDERLLNKAVDDMNYFLNDYRRMSAFERGVVKRFFMPFWSFYKHSAKLMLTYPFTHPERATVLRMLGEVSREFDREQMNLGTDMPLPDWLSGSFPIGTTPEGETTFANTRGANPFSGFTQTLGDWNQVGSMLGPQAKTALEYVTGEDSLTGRPFSDPSVGQPYGAEQQYRAVFDEAGNVVGVEPTQERPNLFELAVGNVPIADMAYKGIAGSTRPEAEMVGQEPQYPFDTSRELGKWIGLSTSDFNVADYEEQEIQRREQALIQILRQLGFLAPAEER